MEFFPRVVFYLPLFGIRIPVTETVVATWAVMAILISFGYLGGKNLKKIPDPFHNVVEVFYEGLEGLVKASMDEGKAGYIPYMGTLTMFILISNLIGLVFLREPTADLSTTLALAGITFVLTQYEGIKVKGILGYIRGFFEPLPFMFPLNIIGAIATPMSMAFRLFGNILGGFVIMKLVYSAVPIIIPAPLHVYFDLFAGILQTFIFVMLTMTFVGTAAD